MKLLFKTSPLLLIASSALAHNDAHPHLHPHGSEGFVSFFLIGGAIMAGLFLARQAYIRAQSNKRHNRKGRNS